MGITAEQGPQITFGQGSFADSNPDAGPSAGYQGYMILDPRAPYSYQPDQRSGLPIQGWYTSTALPLIDQIPSAVNSSNIAASQVPVAATALTLASATANGITVGCSIINAATNQTVTGLLGIDVSTAAVPQPNVIFGTGGAGTGGPIQPWNPFWAIARCVQISSTGNDSAAQALISGYDEYYYPMTQLLTLTNAGIATTKKAFKYIASIVPQGTLSGSNITVGTTDTYGIPLRTDRFPYLSVWWGNPQGFIDGGSVGGQSTIEVPVTLSSLANGQIFTVDMPFDGSLIAINYRATVAATGGGATASLQAFANGSAVTGGLLIVTTTNAGTVGAKVNGSTITGANSFAAGQTIGFSVSSVTGFSTGAGIVELVVQNTDDTGGVFTPADITNPATNLTGDVRGTFATPSASDGTKRLTLFWTPVVANMTTTAGLVGQSQT